MRSTKAHGQNKIMKIITVPFRALTKAYVRSMTDMAGRVSYGNTTAGPGGQLSSGLPKSFSVRSSSSRAGENGDDFTELVRAASARSYGSKIDVDMILREQLMKQSATTTTAMGSRAAPALPKSSSVAMGRIDEDGPCDSDEDAGDVKPDLLYPRSRSHAVGKRGVVF